MQQPGDDDRPPRQLGGALLAVTMLAGGVGTLLAYDDRYRAAIWNTDAGSAVWAATMAIAAAFGLVVLIRGAGGAQSWVLMIGALGGALGLLFDHLSLYVLVVRHGSLWLAAALAALANVGLLVPWAMLGILLPLYFPTGRLLSPRWRILAWVAIGSAAAVFVAEAFAPGPLFEGDWLPRVANPLGVSALRRVVTALGVGYLGLFGGMLGAAASLVIRLWRSTGLERQQLKLVAFAVVVALVGGLAYANLNTVLGPDAIAVRILAVVSQAAYLGIPLAIAVAMLRYRLYDVDVLIRRTVVYVVLTGILLGAYALGVTVVGAAGRAITGQDSEAAVALSTLGVAALFQPVRGRVQAFVDRRFYRARYDAARIVDAFSSRLRERTELDAVVGEVLGVVQATLQPVSASVWLRGDPGAVATVSSES
ncbi:MAG: hypothetical protein ABR520_09045 [Mycobacteriales bacterium]|nr:hypothetical protein [Frankia sp.]